MADTSISILTQKWPPPPCERGDDGLAPLPTDKIGINLEKALVNHVKLDAREKRRKVLK
jgi:hypothetical protein